MGRLTQFDFFLSVRPPNTSLQDISLSVVSGLEKIRAIAEFAQSGFASLKWYIDFARSSDVRLPHMVADIDVKASLIKRLVPSLANFLKRCIDTKVFYRCTTAEADRASSRRGSASCRSRARCAARETSCPSIQRCPSKRGCRPGGTAWACLELAWTFLCSCRNPLVCNW